MLSILKQGEAYPLCHVQDYAVTYLYGGLDKLSFSISVNDPLYPLLTEETVLLAEGNQFVVKSINERTGGNHPVAGIDCELDLTEWKQRTRENLSVEGQTAYQAAVLAAPDGWNVIDLSGITLRQKIELESGTDCDLLMLLPDLFGVVFQFDLPNRTLRLLNPAAKKPLGAYLTEELNLTSMTFKGETNGLVTRIYPRGKDGLSIAEVNGGVDYVEDTRYLGRVISMVWKDERYTNAQSLKNAAEQKLSELAYPVRSYQCTALDLAKMSAEYRFLSVGLYDQMVLIDRRRKNRILHQVVEYKCFPNQPQSNVITLSNTPPKLASANQLHDQIKEEFKEQSTRYDQKITQKIDEITNSITGQMGGHILLNPPKQPRELLILDKPDQAQAENVWRWNLSGLGHSKNGVNGPYDTAITANGEIVADYILAGHLDGALLSAGTVSADALSVAYKESVKEQFDGLEQELTQQFVAADGTLKSEISKVERSVEQFWETAEAQFSKIQQRADSIALEVGTKVGAEEVISAINLSKEGIRIQAKHLQLEGYATFTSLQGEKTTVINGSNITTGTISAAQGASGHSMEINLDEGRIYHPQIWGCLQVHAPIELRGRGESSSNGGLAFYYDNGETPSSQIYEGNAGLLMFSAPTGCFAGELIVTNQFVANGAIIAQNGILMEGEENLRWKNAGRTGLYPYSIDAGGDNSVVYHIQTNAGGEWLGWKCQTGTMYWIRATDSTYASREVLHYRSEAQPSALSMLQQIGYCYLQEEKLHQADAPKKLKFDLQSLEQAGLDLLVPIGEEQYFDHVGFLPYLTRAVQELSQKVEQLETRLYEKTEDKRI